jgi:hypothetical protein
MLKGNDMKKPNENENPEQVQDLNDEELESVVGGLIGRADVAALQVRDLSGLRGSLTGNIALPRGWAFVVPN